MLAAGSAVFRSRSCGLAGSVYQLEAMKGRNPEGFGDIESYIPFGASHPACLAGVAAILLV
jgi:hypothetical protein